MIYVYLFIAIITEVIGTSALKASAEFTKFIPSIITLVAYVNSFYFLSLTLKTMPIWIAYAIWAGVWITLVSLVWVFFYKQSLDTPSIIGISLIVAGVIIINLYSKLNLH